MAHGVLSELVVGLADELALYWNAPFAFFGHSMGALVAYELSCHLQKRDIVPRRLFVSGHRSPELPLSHPELHAVPDQLLVDHLRSLGGTPEALLRHEELLAFILPVLRKDLQACETYAFPSERTQPLECPISAFAGADDRLAPPTAVSGWRKHTREQFALRVLPGNHFFVRSASDALLRSIADDLWNFGQPTL
jgi:medium-chain acyl-[acyl-carrier-protein] hydrolase